MRKSLILILLLCSVALRAWDYASTDNVEEQSVQLRAEANFNKNFRNGVKLHIGEDLRFDMYNSLVGPRFNKSYTTLSMSYAPIEYLRFDAGYTLKIMGSDSTWTADKKADVNEWIRHRIFFGVAGIYRIDRWKLSLRERAMIEMRTDSVNPLEKNKYDWVLRSKAQVEYSCFSKPLKPYVWIELVNTLNALEYQQKYKNNDPTNGGHQFIKRVRTSVGVNWRLNKNNSLDFYYRFNYGYERDVNITKKAGKIELTEEKSLQHAIGVAYNFGW